MKKNNTKGPKKKKLPFGITEEFVGEVESSSADQLKARVITIQNQIEESGAFLRGDLEKIEDEKQKAGAIELQDLKANYTEAAAPCREALRSLRNRNKFVLEALKKSGGV